MNLEALLSLPSAIPDRPQELSPEVGVLWDAVVPRLHRRRILTVVDGPGLWMLCLSMRRYQQFREVLSAGGEAAAAVAEDAEEWRILTRELAAQFFMLPPERVCLAPRDCNGNDEDLMRWFA